MHWLRPILFAFGALGFTLLVPSWFFPGRDFVEYWSAANVFANGGNPYDGAELLPVQLAAKGDGADKAVSLWTPPYTLPIYWPFGLLPFAIALRVWHFIQFVCVFASIEMLWRIFGGRAKWILLPYVIALAFAPVFWLALFGQNTGFLLLGLAGFASFREAKPFLAGAFAMLLAIKPHLLAVVGLLILLDVFRRDGWKVIAAGLASVLILTLIAFAVQPKIFQFFLEALAKPTTPETVSLRDWDVPLLAYRIRHWIDPERFWIQFVPCLLAGIGYGLAKLKLGRNWNWNFHLPIAVLVSCVFAPYGGWIFDLVVLVVPLLALAARVFPSASQTRPTLFETLPLTFAVLVGLFGFTPMPLADYIWFTPALTGGYALAVFLVRPLGGEGLGVRGYAIPEPSPPAPLP